MKLLEQRMPQPATSAALRRTVVGLTIACTALLALPVLAQDGPTRAPGAAVTYEQPLVEVVPKAAAGDVPWQPVPAAVAQTADTGAPLRLRGPGEAADTLGAAKSSWGGPVLTMLGSLSFVLALFFAVAWFMKRQLPVSGWALPGDVLHVLGRATLAPRQIVHLVRLGNRLLLVAVSQAGAQTLAEVTDADEIERLTNLCTPATTRQSRGLLNALLSRPATNSLEVDDD
jgi:flagellar biogenesis protein FliO